MFTSEILEADDFIALKPITKVLYFYLCLNADDDGLINNVQLVKRMTGAKQGDLNILADKNYIIIFPSGVVAIVHWWRHNNKDTLHHRPTSCAKELSKLSYSELTREYELKTAFDMETAEPP